MRKTITQLILVIMAAILMQSCRPVESGQTMASDGNPQLGILTIESPTPGSENGNEADNEHLFSNCDREQQLQAIQKIRPILGLSNSKLEFIEITSIINSPTGDLEVAFFADPAGRNYYVSTKDCQVVEIDARILSQMDTSESAPSSDLDSLALETASAVTATDLAALRYESGSKGDIHFYDWYAEITPGMMMPSRVQLAFLENGLLIGYINTLDLEESEIGICPKIAFVLSRNESAEIYSVCPDGANLTALTNEGFINSHPAWSPDGNEIAFASTRSGDSQIYLMDDTGQNVRKITSDYQNDFPIWVPGTNQIAFRSTDGEGLWWWQLLDLETNAITYYSDPSYDFFFQTPAWSPDGGYIAFMSLSEQAARNDGSSQIHIVGVDGSGEYTLTNDTWANISPQWSPQGDKIAFLSERDGSYNSFALYVIRLDYTLQKLTEPIYTESSVFSWSPDGQSIVIAGDATRGSLEIIDLVSGEITPLLGIKPGESASYPTWQP